MLSSVLVICPREKYICDFNDVARAVLTSLKVPSIFAVPGVNGRADVPVWVGVFRGMGIAVSVGMGVEVGCTTVSVAVGGTEVGVTIGWVSVSVSAGEAGVDVATGRAIAGVTCGSAHATRDNMTNVRPIISSENFWWLIVCLSFVKVIVYNHDVQLPVIASRRAVPVRPNRICWTYCDWV
ncbi:MAG: hypothetical protein ACE5JU_25115, partial [Candidatus Binatia bacterium]